MSAPTNTFLSAINSNIDSLVTAETEVVKIVLKQQFSKTRDRAYIENCLARMLVRDSLPEVGIDPIVVKVESVNDQPVTNPDLVFLKNAFPAVPPEDQYHVYVTWKILAKKGINVEDSFVNFLKGDTGDVARLNNEFVTHIVKEGSCPIPVIKIDDITVI